MNKKNHTWQLLPISPARLVVSNHCNCDCYLLRKTLCLFFIWSGNTACFSNIDAVSCWQKRGKNLSAASSCKVHDKTELWVNGAHNSERNTHIFTLSNFRVICRRNVLKIFVLCVLCILKITKSLFVSRLRLIRMGFQGRGMVMIPFKRNDKTPAQPPKMEYKTQYFVFCL